MQIQNNSFCISYVILLYISFLFFVDKEKTNTNSFIINIRKIVYLNCKHCFVKDVFGNTLRKMILFNVEKSILIDEEVRKNCFL